MNVKLIDNVHDQSMEDIKSYKSKLQKQNNMKGLIDKLQTWLPQKRVDIFGKDSLLKSSLPYYMLTVIPAIVLTFDRPNPYVLIAFAYAGLALLDEVFAFDNRNPTNKERVELQRNDHYFRLPLYTAMILSWGIFFKVLNTFSTIELNMENVAFIIGFGFIASNYYTAQFTISHELMHKPGSYYRIIGTLHLIKFYYMHFTYHHLHRHHVWVGTPKDPSTAKKSQNIYLFIIRSIIFSWKGAYDDERESGKSFFSNFAIISLLGTTLVTLGIYKFYGMQALVIHSLMVLGAVAYLQAINYVEHYGLERKMLPNGQYEKTNILHSWNAPHRFTNYFFFKVQRHSDHHENSSKPYQALTSMDESPFLPHGYILMIVMSFFPKVWFRVMDPLVDAYRKLSPEDKGRIDPEIRDNAIKETRKFLVEIVLVSGGLLFISLARGC